jgi:hypothetical protein
MLKQVHITTPRPSFEEEARRLRIPKPRQKVLRSLASAAFKQRKVADGAAVSSSARQDKIRSNATAAD